jgi:hypothetical protein
MRTTVPIRPSSAEVALRAAMWSEVGTAGIPIAVLGAGADAFEVSAFSDELGEEGFHGVSSSLSAAVLRPASAKSLSAKQVEPPAGIEPATC